MADDVDGVGDTLGAKEDPGEVNESEDEKGADDRDGQRMLLGESVFARGWRPTQDLLEDEIEAVQAAPDDIGPTRTVPKSADEKREEDVEIAAAACGLATAERDIDVVAKPGRKRDVP